MTLPIKINILELLCFIYSIMKFIYVVAPAGKAVDRSSLSWQRQS